MNSAEKSIHWAGYQWFLRDDKNSGPGPNNWDSNNVWIDSNNRLHLKLRRSPTTGEWTCAELYTDVKFSFGTFRWFVEGPIDKFDTNVVFGLFTYGGVDGTNEIDIEVAKWGRTEPEASNFFCTVYPHSLGVAKQVSSGTRISLQGTYTTHQFTWTFNNVQFQSQHGFQSSPNQNILYSYQTPVTFTSVMPYISAPLHMNLWAFQGHKYGVIDVDDVLRGRQTTAQTIYNLTDSYRERIKQILIEPLQQRAVTIRLNVSFVDANHRYFSIDLFCRAYFGVKSGDLIVKSLQAHLQEFGINDLTSVNILCDRGSNFVKGFRDYDPLFCYGHPLNNILKTSVFSKCKKQKKHSCSTSTVDIATSSNNSTVRKEQKNTLSSISDILSNEDEFEDDEDVLISIPVTRNRKKKDDNQQLSAKASVDDIPNEAKAVLLTLSQYAIKLIQVGNSPSLHMVLLCTQTLSDALKSYDPLVNYNNIRDDHQLEQLDEAHDDILEQLERIKFFLNRMRNLLNEMLVLDLRRYAATALHAKYRSLKSYTFIERSQCYHYIRPRLQLIDISPNELNQRQTKEPTAKRFKADPFRRFESGDLSSQQGTSGEFGNESEEYPFATRSIFSIPATSVGVEREFSAAGLVIQERRTNLNPEQLDNILLQ
ncbi:unnamed protein product [Rotaria sordida]|uniref:HAT C-terminal dimerisation domain-containing protein n=3 Tax=Rotaria sordida TaxID=392033 RepID=A0A813XQU6_9BILA|nr:unnamed protein product [Rotaria sordida]